MKRGAGTGTERGRGTRKRSVEAAVTHGDVNERFLYSGLYRSRDACCDWKQLWVLILRWGCFEEMRSIGITSRDSLSMMLPRQLGNHGQRGIGQKSAPRVLGVKVRIGRARVSSLCCRSRRAALASRKLDRREARRWNGCLGPTRALLQEGGDVARDRRGAADPSCGGKTTGESWRVRRSIP